MAVQLTTSTATTVEVRPVLLGEPWLIVAPIALSAFLRGVLGHLPQWSGEADPLTLDITSRGTDQPFHVGLSGTRDRDRREPSGSAGVAVGDESVVDLRGTVQARWGTTLRQRYPGVELSYDPFQRRASINFTGPDILSDAVTTEALARLVTLHAAERGLVPMHAAAIGAHGSFWLVPGKGGTGKSTATAVSVSAGLNTLGDDFVMWDPSTGTLFSVSRTLRLTPQSESVLEPVLNNKEFDRLWQRGDGKRVLAAPAERCDAAGRLAGVLLIGIEAPRPHPADAYRALSSSLLINSQAGIGPRAASKGLATLVRSTPIVALKRDCDLQRWQRTLIEVCGGR